MAAVAVRPQARDKQRKRIILVGKCLEYRLPGLAKKRSEGKAAGHPRPDRDGVHEVADDALEPRLIAPRHRRANEQVFLTRVPVEKNLECRQEECEKRRSFGAGQSLQRLGQTFVDRDGVEVPFIRRHRGARPRRRKLQDRQLPIEARLPILKVRLPLGARHHLALPIDELLVAFLHEREDRLHAGVLRRIDRKELLHQDRHRPEVDDDVAHHEQQHVLAAGAAKKRHPQRRNALEVERAACLAGEDREQFLP